MFFKFLLILSLITLDMVHLAVSVPYGSWLSPNDMANGGPDLVRVKRQPVHEESSRVTWIIDTDGGSDRSSPLVDLTSIGPKGSSNTESEKTINKNDATAPTGTTSDAMDKTGKTTPKPSDVTSPPPKKEQQDSLTTSNEKEHESGEPMDTKDTVILIDSDVDKALDSLPAGKNMPNDGVASFVNKCMRVRCSPAPSGMECKEHSGMNPVQLTGLTTDCCAVHICRREDGSTFFHYAIEVDDEFGTTSPVSHAPQQQQSPSNFANGNNGLPAPPPRPVGLPPFISSFLPPIFPFLPPPSTYYNNVASGRQGPSSASQFGSQSPTMSALFVPPLSGGTLHQTSASFPTQFVFPPKSNSISSQPPSQTMSSQTRKNGQDSPVTTLDRFVRNIVVGSGGGPGPVARFDTVFASAGPFPMDDGFRARRNAMPFVSDAGPMNPTMPMMPNRPGGGYQFN